MDTSLIGKYITYLGELPDDVHPVGRVQGIDEARSSECYLVVLPTYFYKKSWCIWCSRDDFELEDAE